ncbi:MAG: hypothetical protein JSR98_20060 [Proteobacteria bacterium]|nr:hypothetical protein [Pseudomonadota bacterium]
MTTITSDTIQALIVAALLGPNAGASPPVYATGAGPNVFAPRDWPTTPGELPMILVQSPSERKESWGRAAPGFTVVTTYSIQARVTSRAQDDDAAAGALLAALAVLQRQIEVAVINDHDLYAAIQQVKEVRILNDVSPKGEQPVGQLSMEFDVEYAQAYDDFHIPDASAIEELAVFADLVNVFSAQSDLSGDQPDNPFRTDGNPAPRTQGPDGRAEGAFTATLPQ